MLFNQATVQRISSVKTLQEGKRIMWFAAPAFFAIALLVNFESLVMFAYFNVVGCDPLTSGRIKNANQLLPYMVVRIFHGLPGLSGLFLASLFSASLSTISSGLSCLSAQTVQDFIKPRYQDLSDRKATAIAKISVLFYGGVSIMITALIATVSGSLSQIASSVLTCFGGPLSGMFLVSIFCPWSTKKGVLTGGVISIFVFWISLGQNLITSAPSEPWLPSNPTHQCSIDLTFPANATISDSSTFNHNITISLSDTASRIAAYEDEMDMFRSFNPLYTFDGDLPAYAEAANEEKKNHPSAVEVDVRYILPLGDQLFPYLPKKARRYLNFGVDFGKRRRWLEQQTAGTINTQEFCGEIKVELEEVKANDELSVLSTGGVNAFTEKIERTSDTSIM